MGIGWRSGSLSWPPRSCSGVGHAGRNRNRPAGWSMKPAGERMATCDRNTIQHLVFVRFWASAQLRTTSTSNEELWADSCCCVLIRHQLQVCYNVRMADEPVPRVSQSMLVRRAGGWVLCMHHATSREKFHRAPMLALARALHTSPVSQKVIHEVKGRQQMMHLPSCWKPRDHWNRWA